MINLSKSNTDHYLDALVYGFSVQKVETKMGCDIHWYSETKRDGKWVCDQAASFNIEEKGTNDEYPDMNSFPDRGRDYWWFGFLQPGVRSDWDFSFNESLLPNDLSSEVKAVIDHWDSDGHSHGHVTRAMLKAKLEEMKQQRAKALIEPSSESMAINHLYDRVVECIEKLNSDVPDTDQRIIFFFDN